MLILNFIQFDILYTERWLPKFFEMMHLDLNFEEDEGSENEINYLKLNGYDVDYLIGNLGSSFMFILIYAASFIILLLAWLLAKYSTR